MSQEARARQSHNPRDPLLTMVLGNLLWGMGLGLVFAGGVYLLDLGHIRTLVNNSPDGLLAMALLAMGSVITFGSVVMGGAVMLLPREDDRTPPGGGGVTLRALVPLRVKVTAATRARMQTMAHRRGF
jgi:hypothetical protein